MHIKETENKNWHDGIDITGRTPARKVSYDTITIKNENKVPWTEGNQNLR